VLAIALLIVQSRYRADMGTVTSSYDSLVARIKEEHRVEEALLEAGDMLPSVRLRTPRGDTIHLRDLPTLGTPYIYFYRSDCPPCQILNTLLAAHQTAAHDSIAYVAFHPAHDMDADVLPHHYGWLHDSMTSGRFVQGVPSLLVGRADGRVITSAQGSIFRVAKVLDLFEHLSSTSVDSAVNGLRASRNTSRYTVEGAAAEQNDLPVP